MFSLSDKDSKSVQSIEARLDLDNQDYKNSAKVTWLACTDSMETTPTVCVFFDNIITKGILKPDDDFKDYVNWNSKVLS